MQSTVTIQLQPARRGGCCGAAPTATVSDGLVRSPGAPGSSPSSILYPPPHLLSQEHQPSVGSQKATPCLLNLKRLALIRPKVNQPPTPKSGKPSEETEDPSLAKESTQTEIDMQQFKSVRIGPSPKPGTCQKLYVEFYPSHTYKLKVSSAKEASVWQDVFHAYGEYREYGSGRSPSPNENGDDGATFIETIPDPRKSASSDAASLAPYYAYAIPHIYARSIHTLFTYLRTHEAQKKEGLFRTGKSSPLLIRQLLLNDGELEGGEWGRPVDKAGEPSLDVHCLAFCAKNLLRCLPETLLTNALIHKIFDATRWNDVSLLTHLIHFLPPTNYKILQESVTHTPRDPSCDRMYLQSLTLLQGM